MYSDCVNTAAYLITGSSDQLEEKESKRLHAAGERVLARVRQEKNKLQDSNTRLGEELEDVRAQLADSVKENKRLRGGIFSMWPNLPCDSSEIKVTDRVMFVGMLTGRPEEDTPGSSDYLLQGLSQMHEQARQAKRSVAKALWPSASPPGSMEELIELFKRARRHFRLWKISACREGA